MKPKNRAILSNAARATRHAEPETPRVVQRKLCGACQGRGEVKDNDPMRDSAGTVGCQPCRGTGWIAIVIAMLLLALCNSHSATVTGTIRNRQGAVISTNIYFKAIQRPLFDATPSVLPGWTLTTNSASDGTFSTPLLAGNYQVTIGGELRDSFLILVPTNDASYEITSLVTNSAAYTWTSSLFGNGLVWWSNGIPRFIADGSQGQFLTYSNSGPRWVDNAGVGDVSTAQLNTASNAAISTVAGTLKSYATNLATLPTIYTNTIYVNATGAVSLYAVKQLAPAGSLIVVGPGGYFNGVTNLLKNGVNWHFMPGAVISNTASADVGVFDNTFEGTSGAITSSITGDLELYDAGSMSLGTIIRGALTVSNAQSRIRFSAAKMVNTTGDTDAGIRVFDGEIHFRVDKFDFQSGGPCIFWDNGTGYGYFNQIDAGSDSPIWGEGNGAANWFISGEYLESVVTSGGSGSIYFQPTHVNNKLWMSVKEIRGASVAPGYGGCVTVSGGKFYLEYQKMSGVEDTATARALVEFQGGESWIKGMKMTVTNNQQYVWQSGGFAVVENQHFEDAGPGSSTRPYNYLVDAGTNHFVGGKAVTRWAPFLKQTGGRVEMRGADIDTTQTAQTTNAPIWKTSGTLIVSSTILQSGGSTGIRADTAQGATLHGVTSDKPHSANLTVNSDNATDFGKLRAVVGEIYGQLYAETIVATNFLFMPLGTGVAPGAEGSIVFDTDFYAANIGAILAFDGQQDVALIGVRTADTPAAGQFPRFNSDSTITWESPTNLTTVASGSGTFGTLNGTNSVTASNIYAANFIQTNGYNFSMKHGWLSTNLQWRLVKTGVLTNVVDVSAAAYYPSNNTFWTIHNNSAGSITEWTLDGVFVRHIDGSGSGLTDCESITYMGGNTFAVVEEDANRIFIFGITNNANNSTWTTNNSTIIQIPSSVAVDGASSGVEGIAYDWDRNLWWIAHEKTPAQLLIITNQPGTANWFTNNWFTTAQMQTFTNANNTDFSDLYLDRENQILWVAQDEGGTQTDRIIGISLITSNIITTISCTNFGQLEGVSVTPDGYVIAAGEANQFAIFEPVIGGLNSGMTWERNVQGTNSPSVPRFPVALGVGSWGLYVTNLFATNITLDFPQIDAQTETNLQFSLTGAAAGQSVIVSPQGYTAGVVYSGQPSNGVIYIRGHNYSTTAKDPASGSFSVTIIGTK